MPKQITIPVAAPKMIASTPKKVLSIICPPVVVCEKVGGGISELPSTFRVRLHVSVVITLLCSSVVWTQGLVDPSKQLLSLTLPESLLMVNPISGGYTTRVTQPPPGSVGLDAPIQFLLADQFHHQFPRLQTVTMPSLDERVEPVRDAALVRDCLSPACRLLPALLCDSSFCNVSHVQTVSPRCCLSTATP